MARANQFRITTRWRVQASIAEVAAVLTDAKAFPRWWGRVYLSVAVVAPGNAQGIGRKVSVLSKGKLPYSIRWTGELVAADLPHRWTIRASGDLTGIGVWTLSEADGWVEAVYDWRVSADRPLFRLLAPIMAPVFAWNHRWAMARGEEGLRREVVWRRGQTLTDSE
jgi:Polyketide cyclase / dehydrase and lipid transport